MKKLFYLYLLCLFPVLANGTTCSDFDGDTNFSSCYNFGGCSYDVLSHECTQCRPGTYIPQNYTCANDADGCDCLKCENFPDYPDHAIFDEDNATLYGQTECPWQCIKNYYKANDSCSLCPTNSTSAAGSTSISDCQCNNGYYMGGANDDICYQCPEHANNCTTPGRTYSDITCDDDYTASINTTTHTVSCQSCRDSNATLENGKCKCNQNYYGTINGLDTRCTACPRNSTTNGATESTSISACICNIGYYDADGSSTNETVSCTKCPIGMTTVTLDSNGNPTNDATKGATSIDQCAMNHYTQFCIFQEGQRQPCFTLSAATKINDREINTTISSTNSGN